MANSFKERTYVSLTHRNTPKHDPEHSRLHIRSQWEFAIIDVCDVHDVRSCASSYVTSGTTDVTGTIALEWRWWMETTFFDGTQDSGLCSNRRLRCYMLIDTLRALVTMEPSGYYWYVYACTTCDGWISFVMVVHWVVVLIAGHARRLISALLLFRPRLGLNSCLASVNHYMMLGHDQLFQEISNVQSVFAHSMHNIPGWKCNSGHCQTTRDNCTVQCDMYSGTVAHVHTRISQDVCWLITHVTGYFLCFLVGVIKIQHLYIDYP